MTAIASRTWPATALRWMLRITFAFGLLLIVGAIKVQLTPESPESDMPSMKNVAVAGLLFVGLPCLTYAQLGWLAFARRKPWLTRIFLAVTILAPLVTMLVMMTDVREEASASEMNWAVILVPAWGWSLCLLASTASATAAMGVESRLWRRAVSWGAIAAVAAVLATIALCNLRSESPAERALATLRPGMSWHEVATTTTEICPMSRAEVMDGVMWLRCQPSAPSSCACIPTMGRKIELHFDDRGLVRWGARYVLTGLGPRR